MERKRQRKPKCPKFHAYLSWGSSLPSQKITPAKKRGFYFVALFGFHFDFLLTPCDPEI